MSKTNKIPIKQKQDDITNLYAIEFTPSVRNKPTRKGGKPLIHGKPVKFGMTDRDDVNPRLLEIERDSGMKGKVLHFQKNVKNGFDVEQKIHADFKNDKVYFQTPFSGHSEFVDTHRVNDIILTIRQAGSEPRNSHGTLTPQYNEDFEPASPFKVFLTFVIVLLVFSYLCTR